MSERTRPWRTYEHNSEKYGTINLDESRGVANGPDELEYDPGKNRRQERTEHAEGRTGVPDRRGIKIDGIAGPETKGALRASLDTKATPSAPA